MADGRERDRETEKTAVCFCMREDICPNVTFGTFYELCDFVYIHILLTVKHNTINS
jgi:hypothetical protein